MGIIEWLNANSGAIIGITTVVLVGIIWLLCLSDMAAPKSQRHT